MEKVKNFLTSVNFFVTIFVLIGIRIAVCGASIGDALAIIALCSLQGFTYWLGAQKKDTINEDLAKELSDIKSTVSNLLIKNSVKPGSTPLNPDMKRFF